MACRPRPLLWPPIENGAASATMAMGHRTNVITSKSGEEHQGAFKAGPTLLWS